MFRATIREVRFDPLPPGHDMPPACGPSKLNRLAKALVVVFSMTVKAGETW